MSTLGHQSDNSLVSNAFGFLRFPLNFMPYDSDAEWVITGIPFDMATSGRAGGRHGPAAIRQVSTNLAWEGNRWPWSFDLRDRLNVVDCGDIVFNFGDAQDMSDKLQAHAEKLLKAGKRMLSFGGDHFVTLPLLRAHAKHFGKLALVHFDAHTDTYANGSKFDHGTMFYHAPNEGLIDPHHSVQIGIRTEFDHDNGFTVLDAAQVNDRSVDDLLTQIKGIVGDMPVYLTFDIDCLDPAFAPGTGTPVIGGLTSDRALKLVRGMQSLNIVGMDVVEVAPAYDQSGSLRWPRRPWAWRCCTCRRRRNTPDARPLLAEKRLPSYGAAFYFIVAIRAAIFSLLQRLCAILRRNETESEKRNRDCGRMHILRAGALDLCIWSLRERYKEKSPESISINPRPTLTPDNVKLASYPPRGKEKKA